MTKPISGYWWLRAHPTDDLLIEFEIQWNCTMFLFITYSTDHNEILHMSQQ